MAGPGRGGQAARLLGPVGCGGRPPCTPGLSTWWSPRSLRGAKAPPETSPRRGVRAWRPSALIRSRPGYPAVPRAGQPARQRSVRPNPLVLGATLLRFPTPTADRDRPVSRRSEPSSRTAFIGEQPNPWDLLQPQDAMSRHRGAKPPRRCGRSGEISLLSPEDLLSVERRPFHAGPPDH